jgi:c-di-GMP-binding flagellar brake protein YcgR
MAGTTVNRFNLPLDIWERVEIVIGDDKSQGLYVSRIEDFNAQGFLITKPDWVRGGKGLTTTADVFVQYKKPDAMYRFAARMKPYRSGEGQLFQIYSIGRVQRVQRRQFVRIEYSTRLKYAPVKVDCDFKEELVWEQTFTGDISAGGALIASQSEIDIDDILILKFVDHGKLGIPRFILAVCRRKIKCDNKEYIGLEFVLKDNFDNYLTAPQLEKLPPEIYEFDDRTQNRLVRFVFEEQVRERQKGLL